MKKIEAVVRHNKVEEIKGVLMAEGFSGMTITEVRGFGRQKGHTAIFRGTEYEADFLPKVKIEVAVPDDRARRAIDAIMKTAHTGEVGDGKIFVTALDEVIRVRTGETGEAAL